MKLGRSKKLPQTEKPFSHRRFELASPYDGREPGNPLSAERLKAVRGYLNLVDSVHGCIDAATVFGSSVKGRTHIASDIDINLFLNLDLAEAGEFIEELKLPGALVDVVRESDRANEVRPAPLRRRFRGFDLSVYSTPVLMQCLDAARTWEHEPDSWFYKSMLWPAAGLFHMGIGRFNLQEVRTEALDRLDRLHDADRATGIICARIKELEETNRGALIDFPRTTDEFRRYYGLPVTEALTETR